jgi:hypothetical protein
LGQAKSKGLGEAETGSIVSDCLVEQVGLFELPVARDLKKGAAARAQHLFGRVNQHAPYATAAGIFPDYEDRDPPDRRVAMYGGHQVKATKADDLVGFDRDQLGQAGDAHGGDPPGYSSGVYTMFEQCDQVDELIGIICRSSSDFDHRLSSA